MSYFDVYFSHKEPLGYRINYLYCIYQTVHAEFIILGNRFIHIQYVPIHKCFEKYCGSKYNKYEIKFLQAMIPCSLLIAFTSALNTKCLRIYCIILVIMIMNIIPMRNRNSSSNNAPNNIQNC